MRTIKQLLRQPLKSIFGMTFISLAVAVLGVCVGQSAAAQKTGAVLEYSFTTVALATSNYNFRISGVTGSVVYQNHMNEDVAAWVNQKITEHPELVETVAKPGLASAYIPQLSIDNHTNYGYQEYYNTTYIRPTGSINMTLPSNSITPYLTNYGGAMLVVTLEGIGEPVEQKSNIILASGEKVPVCRNAQVTMQGVIDSVVGLEAGYENPTGWPIQLKLTVANLDQLKALDLKVGTQYVVYGVDYFDNSMLLSGYIQEQVEQQEMGLGPYDESLLHFLSEDDKAAWAEGNGDIPAPLAIYGDLSIIQEGVAQVWMPQLNDYVAAPENSVLVYGNEEAYLKYHTASLSLIDVSVLPEYSFEDGSVVETRDIITAGETKTIPWNEYIKRYQVPTIVKLEGSVEAFLAENQLWSNTLEYLDINTHAFPILGVEKLDHIADFARELTRITQGRDFTQEELKSGANMCIISEQVAQLSGLGVGDTINPQFYNYDYSVPYQPYIGEGKGTIMPSAYLFGSTTAFAGEAEAYTIIGLYRQDDAWGDVHDNYFAFTPNTIFVPKTAITSDMDYATQGLFQTVILKNGCIEEFEEIMAQHEFDPMGGLEELRDLFVYYDQGYSKVMDSFHNYEKLVRQVLVVGIVVYGIILGLFLLLYPGRQGRALRTMANFGAPRKDKIAHVLLSALGILLPGTVLGAALGATLWGVVIGRLLTVSSALFSLTLDFSTLALISLAQLVLAMLLVALLAIPMTRHCNLMKRK